MASSAFFNVTYGDQHAISAWDEAVERDQYLHGNDGATGDVSSVHAFNLHHIDTRLTKDQALDYAENRLSQLIHWDKWDPAEAIPFYEETPARYGESREEEFTLTFKKRTDSFWATNAHMIEFVKQRLIREGRFKEGEIISVELTSREAQKPRVESLSARGAAQTRYFITENNSLPGDWDTGFTSLADARTHLEQEINEGRISGNVEIVARTARPDGSPLAAMKVTQMEKVTAKVTWRKELAPTCATEEREGWLFYGRANC